jgi:hypothetical protein
LACERTREDLEIEVEYSLVGLVIVPADEALLATQEGVELDPAIHSVARLGIRKLFNESQTEISAKS